MIRILANAVCLVALLTLVTERATAQIFTSPSGCPHGGPNILIPVGNFSIGTRTVVTVVPIRCSGPAITMFLGTRLPAAATIPFPPACAAGCQLACNPFAAVTGSNPFVPLTLQLPNDPTLIGTLQFCLQAVCFGNDATGRSCVEIGDVTDVIVQ